jgi:hypothetical protein
MGFLGNLFNDVIDIVASPVKVAAKITDDVVETNIEGYVDEIKETIKVNKDEN